MFSKACEYGIRSVIYIFHQSQMERRVNLKEIASAVNSPVSYTSKIIQSLVTDKVISSKKGPNGGYFIEKNQNTTLFDIVKSIDGDQIYNGCGLGLTKCDESKPCPVHYKFKVIRDNLKTMLQNTTVEQLSISYAEGDVFLKS